MGQRNPYTVEQYDFKEKLASEILKSQVGYKISRQWKSSLYETVEISADPNASFLRFCGPFREAISFVFLFGTQAV